MLRRLLERENRVELWLLFARISVYGNIALAAGKLALGIYSSSFFLGMAAMYNTGMVLAKRTALKAYKTGGQPYFAVGAIISVSSILFVLYCLRFFVLGNTMQYTKAVAIDIAAITLVEIGLAVSGIRAAGKIKNPALTAIQLTNLTSGLVSLVLAQTAVLSFAVEQDMSYADGQAGLLFGGFAALIGICMMVRAAIIKHTGLKQKADYEKKPETFTN
jgi:divalent metal cation (Fe/Co/Zn/Cd) transporter